MAVFGTPAHTTAGREWLDHFINPLYHTILQPAGPSHTWEGKRPDTMPLTTEGNSLTLGAYCTKTFACSSDQATVEMHTTINLPQPPAPDPDIVSIHD